MSSANTSTSATQVMASQLLRKISVSDMRIIDVESDVASVIGANCRSAATSIIHLIPTKSIEGAVAGFLQNISTSLAKVIAYSHITRADYVISAHVHSHAA